MPKKMTSRHCEIAAESYTACLLSQAGYDVFVQYGANQPGYDLSAAKGNRNLRISVKGSQVGEWPLIQRKQGENAHQAIDRWLEGQRDDIVFVFAQFVDVAFGDAPRVYVARPPEIAAHLKRQRNGDGYGSLAENYLKKRPGTKYDDKIPGDWKFSRARIDAVVDQANGVRPSAARVESLFRGGCRRFASLAVAESCTGGMAAAALTALPGASEWFGFGVVSYSNAAKMSLLRVPQATIDRFGAVSEETARAMCRGLRWLGAGAGLSITGIAGPDGGSPQKPVGMVCFGWFCGDAESAATEHFDGDRDSIRAQAVARAFDGLIELAEIAAAKTR